jgi:hypothetical protein
MNDAASSKSPLEQWATRADIISKVVVGVAAIFVTGYLTFGKNKADQQYQCNLMVGGLLESSRGKNLSKDETEARVGLIPESCAIDRDRLFRLVISVAESKTIGPTETGSPTPTPITNLTGWVAVGYLNSPAYKCLSEEFLNHMNQL